MDISAALTAPFVPADSVPGQVTLGCGGVARNIAHNLRLMGHDVKFVSAFGGETFGEMCWRECQAIGLDLTLSERCDGMRNGLYLCVNDQTGNMIAAVADTDIISQITPEFLGARMTERDTTSAQPETQPAGSAGCHPLRYGQGCRRPIDGTGCRAGLYHDGQRRGVLQRRLAAPPVQGHPHPRHQYDGCRRRLYRRCGPCPDAGNAIPRVHPDRHESSPRHPTLPPDRQSRRQRIYPALDHLKN